MPLTEEQKLRKKITLKKWKDDNKEKVLEYNKKYRDANKELVALRIKKWKDANKEKVLGIKKKYTDANKQKVAECKKEWANNNKDKTTISRWKHRGIICDNWENIHRVYVVTNKCEFCQEPFKDSYDRCLDHNHSILDSYNIRGILCRVCNTTDVLKDYPIKIYTEICE